MFGPATEKGLLLGSDSGVPRLRRVERVSPEELAALQRKQPSRGLLGAAALIWDRRGRVLLVRHAPSKPWFPGWATPGGSAREGEGPEAALRREVREEVGLEVKILGVSKVFDLIITDGRVELRGSFVQFEARALSEEVLPGPEIEEARWFEYLPPDMAYRRDYLDVFEGRRGRRP